MSGSPGSDRSHSVLVLLHGLISQLSSGVLAATLIGIKQIPLMGPAGSARWLSQPIKLQAMSTIAADRDEKSVRDGSNHFSGKAAMAQPPLHVIMTRLGQKFSTEKKVLNGL